MSQRSSGSFPLYTTFQNGELEQTLRQLDPEGKYRGNTANSGTANSRSSLIKEHSCAVTYPDGTEGECCYTRYGPTWHQFTYRHTTSEGTISLPRQSSTERMENTLPAIEEKAKELAQTAFTAAIWHERQDYFRRATEPAYPAVRPMLAGWLPIPQVSTKRAREIAGMYALCRLLNAKLFPLSRLFDSIEEANDAWKESSDTALFVACLCRWSRNWQLPRFNPLYKEFSLPKPEREPII